MEKPQKPAFIYALHFGDEVYCYVGSSINAVKRFQQHRRDLSRLMHCNGRLQSYCRKRDLNKLTFDVLDICDEADRYEREYALMDKLRKKHPLTNVICNVKQQSYFYKSQTLGGSLLKYAHSMLKFNRLNPTTPVWKEVVRARDEIFAVADKFGAPTELVTEIREVLADLRVPEAYA